MEELVLGMISLKIASGALVYFLACHRPLDDHILPRLVLYRLVNSIHATAAEFRRSWIKPGSFSCNISCTEGQTMNNTATGYSRMFHPCRVKNE
eukprot:scaffold11034_cov155-Skeletonema_dohrnii-CCMP3373.AAC.3